MQESSIAAIGRKMYYLKICVDLRANMTTITVKESKNVELAESLWHVKFARRN